MLIAAALLLAWSIICRIEFLQQKYAQYQAWLYDFQQRIILMEDKWIIVLVLEFLFFIKCLIPLVPTTFLFVISGMVFPIHYALLIDILGLCIIFSARYAMGYNSKSDRTKRLLLKNTFTKKLFDLENDGNPLMLFLFRLIPFVPVNKVSQFYGSLKFDYIKYILISLLGFSPRLISYNYAGKNLFNPFSASFTTPLMIIFTISGTLLLIINEVFDYVVKKNLK